MTPLGLGSMPRSKVLQILSWWWCAQMKSNWALSPRLCPLSMKQIRGLDKYNHRIKNSVDHRSYCSRIMVQWLYGFSGQIRETEKTWSFMEGVGESERGGREGSGWLCVGMLLDTVQQSDEKLPVHIKLFSVDCSAPTACIRRENGHLWDRPICLNSLLNVFKYASCDQQI